MDRARTSCFKVQLGRSSLPCRLSSSRRAWFSANQEIYLADINIKGNAHQMVKLVHTYPSMALPIQRSVLEDRHLLRMKLTRNPECDATGQSFFLAPGDSNIFDASTRSVLNDQATGKIPCFNVVHDATRLAKLGFAGEIREQPSSYSLTPTPI
jgi:hypothetical protein